MREGLMRKFLLFCVVLFLVRFGFAQPADRFTLTHSTFIADSATWTGNVLSSMTVRQGDMLAYVTVASTATGSVTTVYDGLDTGGTVVAEVMGHEMGRLPFEVILASSSGKVTISKTGTARVGLTFYVTHPVKGE
jgi:hypothetical protein